VGIAQTLQASDVEVGGESASGGWLLSSDSHIVEPPDLWTARVPDDESLPRVVREEDGDWWYVDGRKTMSFLGIQPGMRFEKNPDLLRTSGTFDEVVRAAYDPHAYMTANEEDGVWGSVIYPSEGLVLFSVPNTSVVTHAMRVYNDWIAEFCAAEPARLKGIAMVNLDDPEVAEEELRRCHGLGLAGALITVAPPAWAPYRSHAFDAFWAAAADLAMPLSLHVGTERGDPRAEAFQLDVKNVPPSVFVNKDYAVRRTLADLMLSGVFERDPDLRIGTVEHELGWIPFFLDQLDYTYTDRPARGPEWRRFDDPDRLPSQFFRTNCFASFQEDAVGIRLRDLIGVDTLMWGSDYPHTESTFPRSRQILGEILHDLDDEEVRQVTVSNAARLYSIDLPDPSGF
jgi:predicted TIM-barrel fold metal-dependent hydrolase